MIEQSFSDKQEAIVKKIMIQYLLDRRSALCRELASVERSLADLGNPVKNPKLKQLPACAINDT